jgi:hypothetical protein
MLSGVSKDIMREKLPYMMPSFSMYLRMDSSGLPPSTIHACAENCCSVHPFGCNVQSRIIEYGEALAPVYIRHIGLASAVGERDLDINHCPAWGGLLFATIVSFQLRLQADVGNAAGSDGSEVLRVQEAIAMHRSGWRRAAFLNGKASYCAVASGYTYREAALAGDSCVVTSM